MLETAQFLLNPVIVDELCNVNPYILKRFVFEMSHLTDDPYLQLTVHRTIRLTVLPLHDHAQPRSCITISFPIWILETYLHCSLSILCYCILQNLICSLIRWSKLLIFTCLHPFFISYLLVSEFPLLEAYTVAHYMSLSKFTC